MYASGRRVRYKRVMMCDEKFSKIFRGMAVNCYVVVRTYCIKNNSYFGLLGNPPASSGSVKRAVERGKAEAAVPAALSALFHWPKIALVRR
jgi:hypothetical protein